MSKKLVCPECGASGRVRETCSSCKGTGRVLYEREKEPRLCIICMGHGVVYLQCPTCSGEGYVHV